MDVVGPASVKGQVFIFAFMLFCVHVPVISGRITVFDALNVVLFCIKAITFDVVLFGDYLPG